MNDDNKAENHDAPAKTSSERTDTSIEFSPFLQIVLSIFMYFFALFVGALIGIFVAGFVVLLSGEGLDLFELTTASNLNNFLFTAVSTAVLLLLILGVLKLQRKSFRSIGLIKPRLPDIPRAITGYIIYIVLIVAVLGLLEMLDVGIDLEQEQLLDFEKVTDTLGLILVFFSVVVSPAFIEEVLMRGFLFMGLRKKLSFWQSTLIVSILFGIAHLQFGTGEPLLWSGFVDTFVLSIVLCGLTEKYKSLWPAIFVHAIKNSIAFYVLFVH